MAVAFSAFGAAVYARVQEHNYVPPKGYVPDAETATAVALAVLSPVYGKEKIQKEAPFRTTLVEGVWTVQGSLPPGYHGGTALVKISRKTGAVLRMTHGK